MKNVSYNVGYMTILGRHTTDALPLMSVRWWGCFRDRFRSGV